MNGDGSILTAANKKTSTHNAKLLVGLQTCIARTNKVVDLQHGQRARGARQAGVGSGGIRQESSPVFSPEGKGESITAEPLRESQIISRRRLTFIS